MEYYLIKTSLFIYGRNVMPGALLRANDVHKSFARRSVLRGISFSIYPETLVGIVGANGAGKSTLLRILVGELRPSRGEILQYGSIGYCPQIPVLNDTLTVDQHLDYFRAAYNMNNLHRAYALMEQLDYQQYRKARVGTLSGGTKQKLNLTLALMHQPKVLLLDEPSQGFDWETYLCFWDVVTTLSESGCAVLIISHLFSEWKRFNVLYHLQEGQLTMQAQDSVATDVLIMQAQKRVVAETLAMPPQEHIGVKAIGEAVQL
jgi:ABC-2 type transport system ATP-binding protein